MHPQSIILPFDNPRFWAKVDFDGPLPEYYPDLGPCWLWIAGKDEWGYGYFGVNRRPKRSHRYSFEMTYGLIPDGLLVCHVCDRPACVNPRHFRLGTNKDNSDDKIRKGREIIPHPTGDEHWTTRNPGASPIIGTKGEANPGTKLTEDAVRAIRRRYALGDVSQLALATEYGVSQTVIHHLLARKTWTNVEDDLDAPPAKPRVIVPLRGEARASAKITENDVRAIRTRYAAGNISMSVLGREYGIGAPNVWMIVHRKTWTHLA
jgi:hypothetical protein